MPAGPAAAGAAHRRRADPDHALVFRRCRDRRAGRRAPSAPIPHTDIATMTQALADSFAAAIAAHPADWHMLQRLWSDDLDHRAAGRKRTRRAPDTPARNRLVNRRAVAGSPACASAWPARTPGTCPAGFRCMCGIWRRRLLRLGHEVSVITPVDDEDALPAVRGVRRQGDVGALQRLGHPDPDGPGVGVTGAALGT